MVLPCHKSFFGIADFFILTSLSSRLFDSIFHDVFGTPRPVLSSVAVQVKSSHIKIGGRVCSMHIIARVVELQMKVSIR